MFNESVNNGCVSFASASDGGNGVGVGRSRLVVTKFDEDPTDVGVGIGVKVGALTTSSTASPVELLHAARPIIANNNNGIKNKCFILAPIAFYTAPIKLATWLKVTLIVFTSA